MALPRPGWGTWLGHSVSLATVPSPVRLETTCLGGGRASGECGAGQSQPPPEPSELL